MSYHSILCYSILYSRAFPAPSERGSLSGGDFLEPVRDVETFRTMLCISLHASSGMTTDRRTNTCVKKHLWSR